MRSPHALLFVLQTDGSNGNFEREYNEIKVKFDGLFKAGTITKAQ